MPSLPFWPWGSPYARRCTRLCSSLVAWPWGGSSGRGLEPRSHDRLARHVRQQFCGGCRPVKYLLDVLFSATRRFLHEEPFNRAIIELEGNRIPVHPKNLVFKLLQALPTKVGPRVLWGVVHGPHNLSLREHAAGYTTALQEMVQALVRAHVVILQVHHGNARVVPATVPTLHVIGQQMELHDPVNLA